MELEVNAATIGICPTLELLDKVEENESIDILTAFSQNEEVDRLIIRFYYVEKSSMLLNMD